MLWLVLALIAAVLWGASYVAYEQLLKTLSLPTVMFTSFVGSTLIYGLWALASGTFAADWQVVKRGGAEARMIVALIALWTLANLAFTSSLKLKNATIASMIEITYPLFTALFAWMFFREMQVTAGTLAGGLLIMAGVACIFYFEKT